MRTTVGSGTSEGNPPAIPEGRKLGLNGFQSSRRCNAERAVGRQSSVARNYPDGTCRDPDNLEEVGHRGSDVAVWIRGTSGICRPC